MTEPTKRVTIQWTTTAKECLARLPREVRKGLLAKADRLYDCSDPRRAHKPLTGPLQGYYRITFSRYRAIYSVREEKLANDDVLLHVIIRFVAAGKREEHSRTDVYRVAEKLVELRLIEIDQPPESKEEED